MSQRSYADILRTGARNRENRGYELAGSYEEEFPLPPRPQKFPRTRQPRQSRNVIEPVVHSPRRVRTNINSSRHVSERHISSTQVTQAPHSFEHFTYVSPSTVQLSNSRRQHSHAQPASHSHSRRYAQGTSSTTATHRHTTESRSTHASYPDPLRTVHTSTNVATKATKRVSHQVSSTPLRYPKEQGRQVTIPKGTTQKHQLQVTVSKTTHNSASMSIVKHSGRQASDQPRSARVESKRSCYVEHRDPVSESKKQKVKSVVVSTSSDKEKSRETRVSHTRQGSDSRSARSNEKACEEVVNLLKQLYTLVDRQVISDVVAARAAPLNPFN